MRRAPFALRLARREATPAPVSVAERSPKAKPHYIAAEAVALAIVLIAVAAFAHHVVKPHFREGADMCEVEASR